MNPKEKQKMKKISLKYFKANLQRHFQDGTFISILLSEPDELDVEEFIGAVGVWLNILDLEKQQVFSSSNSKIKESGRK